jgi:hypothetical protein
MDAILVDWLQRQSGIVGCSAETKSIFQTDESSVSPDSNHARSNHVSDAIFADDDVTSLAGNGLTVSLEIKFDSCVFARPFPRT